jgi:hypothetical protein
MGHVVYAVLGLLLDAAWDEQNRGHMCGFPVCAQGLRHELSYVREKLLEAKTATMTELLQVGMSAACVISSDSFSMSCAQQMRSC